MGDFHKPLMANMEKHPTLPNNYENLFGKSHVFKTNMVKNNEQATVHEFKFFDIFQNVKKYEFSWSHYTMTFVVRNPLWICGSHQNIILMMWLIKLTNCCYESEALRTRDAHLKCMNLARKSLCI